MRPAPQIAIEFLKRAEACRLRAYRDAGGMVTIGYGHTGPDVSPRARIDQLRALEWLHEDVAEAGRLLARRVRPEVIEGLSEHQYAALLSFVFNLGASPRWTIWKLLNSGDLEQVPAQVVRFDRVRLASGKMQTLPGLTHRRAAEVALWRTADAIAAATVANAAREAPPPSSATRAAETPPTPAAQAPLVRSGSFHAAVATAVAATPVAIDRARAAVSSLGDALSPYADRAALVSKALGVIAVVCALLAALSVITQWTRHRREAAA